ncbi:hypothetical protein M3J09_010810 [Ascochyta lentis]
MAPLRERMACMHVSPTLSKLVSKLYAYHGKDWLNNWGGAMLVKEIHTCAMSRNLDSVGAWGEKDPDGALRPNQSMNTTYCMYVSCMHARSLRRAYESLTPITQAQPNCRSHSHTFMQAMQLTRCSTGLLQSVGSCREKKKKQDNARVEASLPSALGENPAKQAARHTSTEPTASIQPSDACAWLAENPPLVRPERAWCGEHNGCPTSSAELNPAGVPRLLPRCTLGFNFCFFDILLCPWWLLGRVRAVGLMVVVALSAHPIRRDG